MNAREDTGRGRRVSTNRVDVALSREQHRMGIYEYAFSGWFGGCRVPSLLFWAFALVIAILWWASPWFYGVSTANPSREASLLAIGVSVGMILVGYALASK